ncbi:MAG TPA: hypothetical protein VF235_08640, partial [Actinomycetota bacterium]
STIAQLQASVERSGSESAAHVNELAQELESSREAVRAAEQRAAELETKVAELTTASQMGAEAAAEIERLQAALAAAEQGAADTASAPTSEETERALAEMQEELDAMQLRLRRAYAESEDLRAQLTHGEQGSVYRPSAQDGLDEAQKLRMELARAVERATAAEERAAQLTADLQEARFAADPVSTPAPAGTDVAAAEEDEKSLRFRLARSASKKKGTVDGEWS